MYSTIFFDLDGTLTDSEEGITKSVQYGLKKMGVTDCDDLSALRHFIGPPLSESFKEFFEGEDIKRAIAFYRERYSTIGWKENRLYDGIKDMLKKIKESSRKIYMATSKPEIFAKDIAELFEISEYFDGICGATTDGVRNTKEDVVKYAIEVCGETNPDNILMVGDRHHDVDGAGEFGIKTLGVTYGFGTREELLGCGAIAVVDTPDEVVKFITK
jgi:phosphoglycolate phosphatase